MIPCCKSLQGLKYDIQGSPLVARADELARMGHRVLKCNVGDPGSWGFEIPQAVLDPVHANVCRAVPYEHQKGLPEARRVICDKYTKILSTSEFAAPAPITPEDVYIGNGVSELIQMATRALLNPGDEVLLPRPDYPLWTAAVLMHGGVPVYYECDPDHHFLPRIEAIRARVTARTRALVVVNPNNPTGVVYPKELLQDMVDMAEEYPFGGIVIFADEIYDGMRFDGAPMHYMASLVRKTLCCSFGGLSKVYRATGLRVGWLVTSGDRSHAQGYLNALNMLSGLRLCANVPGQFAVKPALEGYQSITALTAPGGRLYEARQAVLEKIGQSRYMTLQAPEAAMYAFIRVSLPQFNDEEFAQDLLETHHILVTPGRCFQMASRHYFRITLLPPPADLAAALDTIEGLLEVYAGRLEEAEREALRILQAIRGKGRADRLSALQAKAAF